MHNIDDFVSKWKNCEYNGWKMLSHNFTLQIAALKVHISKRCLSDIVKGGGTNRNEALHCRINPHFCNKTRIGLPLALKNALSASNIAIQLKKM